LQTLCETAAVSVRFHSEVFREVGFDPDHWNEQIVVESSDPVAVSSALAACAQRMVRVGLGGREYTDDELNALDDQVLTPNYAHSDTTDGLPSLYVDCQGVVGGHRSVTFRRVIRDELARVGVTDALVRPVDSLPGAVKPVVDREPAPSWVRFADSDPAGFPPQLMPTGVTVVHRLAEELFAQFPGGRNYADDWLAAIYLVSELEPNELLRALSDQLLAAGCSARALSAERATTDIASGYSELVWETLDIHVGAIRLKGTRGKPAFLRRRPEVSAAVISVVNINPDPCVPRRPDDDRPRSQVKTPRQWRVTLVSGSVIEVWAERYAEEGDSLVFVSTLRDQTVKHAQGLEATGHVAASPPRVAVIVARIPTAAVRGLPSDT
jgi:hypothetical protein